MARVIEARLAPVPAMQRAIELIEENGAPWGEKLVEARALLFAAMNQAVTCAAMQRHPDTKQLVAAILGVD